MANISVSDITSGTVSGNGVFDVLMQSINAQLDGQYNLQRIKGADYASAYVASMEVAMRESIAFLLGKQQADKQADLIQKQIDVANLEMFIKQQQNDKDLELKDVQIDSGLYELNTLKPKQVEEINEKIESLNLEDSLKELQINTEISLKTKQLEDTLLNSTKQREATDKDIEAKSKQIEVLDEDILVKEQQIVSAKVEDQVKLLTINKELELKNKGIEKLDKDIELASQKIVTEQSQIVVQDTQRQLYEAQKDSFNIDAKVKVAKLLTDTWQIRRTTDDTLPPPYQLSDEPLNNAVIDVIESIGMTAIDTKNLYITNDVEIMVDGITQPVGSYVYTYKTNSVVLISNLTASTHTLKVNNTTISLGVATSYSLTLNENKTVTWLTT